MVVGRDHTLLLDAGSSPAHVHELLIANARPPRYVALTHWHWDHIFGAAELGVPVIAHALTAEHLAIMAGYDWSDAALDARVQTGEESIGCARDVKIELPEPRQVTIAVPDLVFHTTLDIDLGGGITCHIQHVGGDHSDDCSVMFVEPDKVLFVGDCLCEASSYHPAQYYTRKRLYPLLDTLFGFDPQLVVEGHNPEVMNRAAFESLANKMRQAGDWVERLGADEAAVLAGSDEELRDMVHSFSVGRAFEASR
jgi:glyoxylase-like metal-dependent hydrolase (beta-lactamase superfamily II)